MSFQTFQKSPPIYFLACETCPNCQEMIFAAEGAELTGSLISYRWTCDLCGYAFKTETQLADEVEA